MPEVGKSIFCFSGNGKSISNAGSWTTVSFSDLWLSLARVFPNLCILLTRHAPLHQEEFT